LPKHSQKQLRAIDAIGTLREVALPTPHFSAERTAVPLASYFKKGGSSLRCDTIVDYGIAMLLGHRSEAATIRELEGFKNPRMAIEGRQIVRAMVVEYGDKLEACVKVPRKWVRVRNGLGVWLPQAILMRIEGKRRFIIVQPRRACDPLPRRADLYLSLFNNYHSIEDNRGVLAEILDLQCAKGVTVRPRKVIRSEDVVMFAKPAIDQMLAAYADAMTLILKAPAQYGVTAEWAESAQQEFDFHW